MAIGADFHIILSEADQSPQGFRSPAGGLGNQPLQVELFGQQWFWMYAGECKRAEEYKTIGEPIAHADRADLQTVNCFAFLRDRAEEFHQSQPDQAIYRCIEEGILSFFEVFDDGAFDFLLTRNGFVIAFSHFKPLHVAVAGGKGTSEPGAMHIVSAETPPQTGSINWRTYKATGRARGKLLALLPDTLIIEEPVW